jgi:hypothetical protein
LRRQELGHHVEKPPKVLCVLDPGEPVTVAPHPTHAHEVRQETSQPPLRYRQDSWFRRWDLVEEHLNLGSFPLGTSEPKSAKEDRSHRVDFSPKELAEGSVRQLEARTNHCTSTTLGCRCCDDRPVAVLKIERPEFYISVLQV